MSADEKSAVLKELKKLHDKAETDEQWATSDFGGLNLQHGGGNERELRRYINIAIKAVKAAK